MQTITAPLAYHITFTTYGTRLHGDDRGTVDRHTSDYGTPRITPHIGRNQRATQTLKSAPVSLDQPRREAVRAAIAETATYRGWFVHALNVRTNHVHSVVDAPVAPEKVVNALKANATRVMRERGVWREDSSPWTKGASTRYLWDEFAVDCAVDYVLNGQGADLP